MAQFPQASMQAVGRTGGTAGVVISIKMNDSQGLIDGIILSASQLIFTCHGLVALPTMPLDPRPT